MTGGTYPMRTALAVVVLLLLATPAQAHFGKGLGEAQEIAERRFPTHCEPVTLKEAHQLPVGYVAYADQPTCTIEFGEFWHYDSWAWRCTALVHEYGHLAGYLHTTERRNIMFPRHNRVYRGCKR